MALFKINKGDSTRLESQKAHEGYAYFTPDDGKFYIDVSGDGTQAAVINESRIPLNAVKADADAAGNVITETYITVGIESSEAGQVPKTNANQLGGIDAEQYATKNYVSAEIANMDLSDFMLKTDTAVDSEKLGGIAASEYVSNETIASLAQGINNTFYKKTEVDTLIANAGGAQGNWNQNDSSAKDYIQNRTHWEYEMEPVTLVENLTVQVYGHDSDWGLSWQSTYSWNDGGILWRGDWSETEFTPLVDFTPKIGQIMTVQIGSDIYSGELIQEGENGWMIGDPTLCECGEDFSVLDIPVTHNYYFGLHDMRVYGWDTWYLYAYFDPSVGYAYESYPVTVTISGTDYHPIDENYLPKTAATFSKVYPIGSIYISTVSTSPAFLFGGEWTQLTDRFLLAAGSTYAAGRTGGKATHTLSTSEMPKHTHAVGGYYEDTASSGAFKFESYINAATTVSEADKYYWYAVTTAAGTGAAHNNMPPYLTVYMWERVG